MMKVLHLNTDFLYTKLYNLMYVGLEEGTSSQVVYSATKKSKINAQFKIKKYKTIISPILNRKDSFFFKSRITKTYKDLKSKISLSDIDIIHAHFMFTDGALALKIYEKYKIQYIVAIRNTDLNLYYKYFPHLKKTGKKILLNAKKIIVISPSYKIKILECYSDEKEILNSKIEIIPNGINEFWLKEKNQPKLNKSKRTIKFLFVGEITKNKNLKKTIDLLKKLSNYHDVKFTIIGEKLDGYKELRKIIKKYNWIELIQPIYNKSMLKKYYRDHDFFIMLSKKETFGLVYIESLSQGTPVFYTKNEGIDGYFTDGLVGYSIDVRILDFLNFKEKVDSILKDYNKISDNCINESKSFNWTEISKRYIKIYDNLM